MLNTKRRSSHGYIAATVITLLSVLIALFLILNRQQIIDQVYVWQYQPTREISAFSDRTGMSDRGEFLFYASQPTLEDTQAFNSQCTRHEPGTAILGCYDGRTIYIYDVPNSQLDGIREVTAAHEMMHAAYQRLDDTKKQQVNELIEIEFQKLKSDESYVERMAFYERNQPGEQYNELHSIIATEIGDINPGLETYFSTYFDDRAKTVQLHAQYAGVFASLQARGQELANQLTALAATIEQKTAQYNRNVEGLNQAIEQFNRRAEGNGFSSQQQFNAERKLLIERVNQLDLLRDNIDTDRNAYNSIREELVIVASQSDALNQSIDSSLAPAPSL